MGIVRARKDCRCSTTGKKTHRAALSYSSKSGMARSFMFFGTARTSAQDPGDWLCQTNAPRVKFKKAYFVQASAQERASCIPSAWLYVLVRTGTTSQVSSYFVRELPAQSVTMNVSKLGLHHCAKQSPISHSLSSPCDALNWRESVGGARRSSRRALRPSISSSPGFR